MKYWIIIVCLFFPFLSFSNDTLTSGSIGYYYNYSLNASSIGAKQIIKYYSSNYIENEFKDELLTFNKNCRFNFNTHFGHAIFGFNFENKKLSHLTFGLNDRSNTYGVFTNDALNIFLNGNKVFAGDTAILNPVHLNNLNHKEIYTQLTFNLNKNKTFHTITIKPKLLFGNKYSSYKIDKSSIYTQQIGEFIDVILKGTFISSDSLNRSAYALNGFGLGADIDYSRLKNNSNILFSIKDFSFISWNKQTSIIEIDTSIYFEGIIIDDITNLTDSILTHYTDSLTNFNFGSNKRHTFLLPTTIHLEYSYLLEKGKINKIYSGLLYKFNAYHRPLFYTGIQFNLQKSNLKTTLNFGGYNSFGINSSYNVMLGNYGLSLWVNNIQSILFKKSSGLGFGINLKKEF